MKKPRIVYLLHQLDGSGLYGVFSSEEKAALENYRSGHYGHITPFVVDDPLADPTKTSLQPTDT